VYCEDGGGDDECRVLAGSKAVSVNFQDGDDDIGLPVVDLVVATRNEATWLETMREQANRRRTLAMYTMSVAL
jgi:hypothetical protein